MLVYYLSGCVFASETKVTTNTQFYQTPIEGKIRKVLQGKTPLYLISVFPFENIETARKFIWENKECFGSDYMVLEGQNAPSKFIIGAITAENVLADRQLQKSSQCIQRKRLKIIKFK